MVEELHEPLDDGQSQTQPLSAVPLRIVELTKLLKNLPMLVLWNPSSGIPDFNSHCIAAAPRTQNDPAPVGIANRVGNQVSHDSFEQHRVTAYKERVAHHREFKILLARYRLVLDPDSLHQRGQGDGRYARMH